MRQKYLFLICLICHLFLPAQEVARPAIEIQDIEIHDEKNHTHLLLKETIDRNKSASLGEILSKEPQIQVINTGALQQITVRGQRGSRVNILQ